MKVVKEFCNDISKYYPDTNDFYSWYIALCIINGILALSAIFGNTIIICALTKTTCALSPSQILLLGLAFSDLGVGLVVQPLYISMIFEMLRSDSASPDDSECKTKIAFLVVGTFLASVSFFVVSAISFDRFLAISLHLRYREIVTEKRVGITLTVLWTLSAIAALGYLFMGDVNREAVSSTFAIIFFVTTTITFVRIYLAVRKHRLQIKSQEQTASENCKELALSKRKLKSAVNILYVYIVFTACYLPYTGTMLIIVTSEHGLFLKGMFQFSMTLGFFNSSLNPILYCWRMREIRRYVLKILKTFLPCFKTDQGTEIPKEKKLSILSSSHFKRDKSTKTRASQINSTKYS